MDNIVSDIRNELGFKGRILSYITYLPFVKKIYDAQIKISFDHINELLRKNQNYYENNQKVKHLLSKYKIEKSTEFGCKLKFKINNQEYSCHYLDIADRVEAINKFADMSKISTYFEIGGGFGSNVHFLLNNFSNIRKVIYLDMVPNLFVGTEYLRSFFGDSVKDYCDLKKNEQIKFSENNNLEIYCIPPWKIENISGTIDHFHNSASFQEMPEKVVKNYSNFILELLKNKGSISLIVYDGFDRNKTLSPTQINNIFKNNLDVKEFARLDNDNEKIFFLISKWVIDDFKRKLLR